MVRYFKKFYRRKVLKKYYPTIKRYCFINFVKNTINPKIHKHVTLSPCKIWVKWLFCKFDLIIFFLQDQEFLKTFWYFLALGSLVLISLIAPIHAILDKWLQLLNHCILMNKLHLIFWVFSASLIPVNIIWIDQFIKF